MESSIPIAYVFEPPLHAYTNVPSFTLTLPENATLRRIITHRKARQLRALLPDIFRLYWRAARHSPEETTARELAYAIGATMRDFFVAPNPHTFLSCLARLKAESTTRKHDVDR